MEWIIVGTVVAVLTVLACCKISGDCAREEERDGKDDSISFL